MLYLTLDLTNESVSKSILYSIVVVIIRLGSTCYTIGLLPFLTDQLIGATSDELSTVVQWYTWTPNLAMIFCAAIFTDPIYQVVKVGIVGIFAIPLALTIFSDCLCQQWLDRTHKVTNPMKLIMQVLNYTRKHSCPERRSAFTYFDEEHPT